MQAKIWNFQKWINTTDPTELFNKYDNLLKMAGFGVINYFEYHFHPFGYSAIWLLYESHFAIHTFPEENKTYIELSSCNEEMLIKFKEFTTI